MALNLDIEEKRVLFGHLMTLQTLLRHDELWTGAVEAESRAATPKVPAVRGIGKEMDELIARSVDAAAHLKEVFTANDAAIDEMSDPMLASQRPTAEQRESWLQLLQRGPSLAQIGIQAMDVVERNAPREREQIRTKVESLDRRGKADGDLSDEMCCGILVGVSIGCAAGELWPQAFIAAVGAAVVCSQV